MFPDLSGLQSSLHVEIVLEGARARSRPALEFALGVGGVLYVRARVLYTWLHVLKALHPDYKDVQIGDSIGCKEHSGSPSRSCRTCSGQIADAAQCLEEVFWAGCSSHRAKGDSACAACKSLPRAFPEELITRGSENDRAARHASDVTHPDQDAIDENSADDSVLDNLRGSRDCAEPQITPMDAETT